VSSGSPSRFVHHGAFGNDRFGVTAERFARFFGRLASSSGRPYWSSSGSPLMPPRSASGGTLTHSSSSTSHSRPRRPTLHR